MPLKSLIPHILSMGYAMCLNSKEQDIKKVGRNNFTAEKPGRVYLGQVVRLISSVTCHGHAIHS